MRFRLSIRMCFPAGVGSNLVVFALRMDLSYLTSEVLDKASYLFILPLINYDTAAVSFSRFKPLESQ